MGGQACVFYGAAEFSRNCDIVVVTDSLNLSRLTSALAELHAGCIAVPPMDWTYLDRGHAIHFRCQHVEASGIRVDVMTKMRGCEDFETLWHRRTTLRDADGMEYEILGIEDLVKAKKTQREKDWPMIRRLVDSHFQEFADNPTEDQVRFWLRESRTPEVLISVAANNPDLLKEQLRTRPLLVETLGASRSALAKELEQEQKAEMLKDEVYWGPLKKELEALRKKKRKDTR